MTWHERHEIWSERQLYSLFSSVFPLLTTKTAKLLTGPLLWPWSHHVKITSHVLCIPCRLLKRHRFYVFINHVDLMDDSALVKVRIGGIRHHSVTLNPTGLQYHMASLGYNEFIYLLLDKMATFSQTIRSDAFSWMKRLSFDKNFAEVCS